MIVKRLIFVGVLISLTLLVAACSGGQPNIDLGAERHDFGQVAQGQVVTAAIPVHNTGNGTLQIETVSTSCGCTSASVEPASIPPGGEGVLTVRYDSGVHPDAGPVERVVFIASNDPDTPEAQVLVTAHVAVAVR